MHSAGRTLCGIKCMTDGATHGIPASKTVPFMPSLLLRHFRFNIPLLLFRLPPDSVFRFLHIPRAAPEAVLPPFRITVVYSAYYVIRKATCRERHILPRPTPQPERLFRNTEEPVSYCQRAFPTPRENPYETSEEALPQHRKHLSAMRKRVDRHTEWG